MKSNYPSYGSMLGSESADKLYKILDVNVEKYRNNHQRINVSKKEKQ